MTHESVLGTKHDRKKHVELPVIRMKNIFKKNPASPFPKLLHFLQGTNQAPVSAHECGGKP